MIIGRLIRRTILPGTVLLLWTASAIHAAGAGPQTVATINRGLWPEAITSPQAFDKASRHEELAFLQSLSRFTDSLSDSTLRAFTGLKSVNRPSVERWLLLTRRRIFSAFNSAGQGAVTGIVAAGQPLDSLALMGTARTFGKELPPAMADWYGAARKFYDDYLYEQVRLASLFPKVTSEILTLSDQEMTGFELADKHFMLTLDDGPTVKGGMTDSLIGFLKKEQVPVTFFLLGKPLRTRLTQSTAAELVSLYSGMTVGSHGMEHLSHAESPEWKASILGANCLLDSVFSGAAASGFPFRPPYGQRKDSVLIVLSSLGSRCVLWNIDTQDWNARISPKAAADRALTLMLLWRRGIILFHDVHPKAVAALPSILKSARAAGVVWVDYRTLR